MGGCEELFERERGTDPDFSVCETVLCSVSNNVVTYSTAIVTNVEGWSVGSFDGSMGFCDLAVTEL